MALEPITRAEQIMSGESLEPITREEMFLAKAAGMDVNTPKPITRREMFLSKISGGGGGSGGGDSWIGDGNTHVWISLTEGRTSPMLGCCPNGTVTVDWGDGTAPDVLTGTSTTTVKWTPTHNYASAGDYVITLTVDGEMGFYGDDFNNQYSGILRYASDADNRNLAYLIAVKKVEIGNGVTNICEYAFENCRSMSSIAIPGGVTSISDKAFRYCYSLSSVEMQDGVTSIGYSVFQYCCSLPRIIIPDSVTSIGSYAFQYCYALSSVKIPDGVTSINMNAFDSCYNITSIKIPGSVTSIDAYAFQYCVGVRYYDFTASTSVPSLSSGSAFNYIAKDCQMRIPAALYDEWSAATNWAQFASYMVAV